MAGEFRWKYRSTSGSDAGVERRSLFRFGTLLAAITGASAVSAVGTNSAHAAPGDKNSPINYVPVAEKGAASGVATLDIESKVPAAQLPDFSATYVGKGSIVLNVKDFGATGLASSDDTAKIQAAINAAPAGAAIFFPWTGSSNYYKITDKLIVTTPNLRFMGQPRDGYAMSIRCSVASKTMIEVKAPGFVLQDLALFGDSAATNGAGATVLGLDLFGDTDGNIDASVRGATFQGLAVGARTRGRNTSFTAETIFSNCLKGVVIDGKDSVYHTGPSADQNRGNTIRQCRFHNIGSVTTDAAIEITRTAKVLHALIAENYFDSNGLGRHVVATGTAAHPHKGLTVYSNKHTECRADVYAFEYVWNSRIDMADMMGYTIGPYFGHGIVMSNCNTVQVRNVTGLQLGGSGIVGTNNTGCDFRNSKFRAIGIDPESTGHGFDFDSTNSQCTFDDLAVDATDGWGFIGSPANSKFGRYSFRGCALGGINSNAFIPDQVYLPAVAMSAVTGAPNLAGVPGVGYPAAWQLDANVIEQVVGQVNGLPNDWETFDAYIVWAATDSTVGNVVWDLNYSFIVAGQPSNSGNTSNPGAAQATSGVAGRVARYKIVSGKARSTAPMVIRVDRNAASGSDTYGSDVSLIGVQLVRAS